MKLEIKKNLRSIATHAGTAGVTSMAVLKSLTEGKAKCRPSRCSSHARAVGDQRCCFGRATRPQVTLSIGGLLRVQAGERLLFEPCANDNVTGARFEASGARSQRPE